ncbi:carboxylate--amine ligase [Subtercola boreus]|uniref:Carboxylate--amine ligase n=1 Tax=Subtercola boreus TaxID=120213 RepID=A0A3E0VZA1_9MICO|nr:PAC2 family protein [Subtercola boreus]RFA14668.1 carboxylate--amine ligase [Subtercola boreus]
MAESKEFLTGRLMVVAFEGWNDAGEAASAAVRSLKEQLDLAEIVEIDSEDFFDYQFNRPTSEFDDEGQRILVWPSATIYGPAAATGDAEEAGEPAEQLAADAGLEVSSNNTSNVYLLLGTEPSRNWKRFTSEVLNVAVDSGVSGIVFLGAMLADVPHTRPISIYSTSENAGVRTELDLERSAYEGPVGILSILSDAAEQLGIPTVSLWASVPHYVHNAPSPKATLALIDRLEELIDVVIPRGDLVDEAAAWESGINALAGEDEEMASYIQQLEQARDTVDSPEASGEAIAQEFERYLRKRGDGPATGPAEPWRP